MVYGQTVKNDETEELHMIDYGKRAARVVFGLFLFSLGSYLNIRANIGLGAWESLSMGLSYLTGARYGVMSVATSVVILGVDLLLRERIGLGTILDAALVGTFVDLLSALDLVPMMTGFWAGLGVLLFGQVLMCVGSYFYMGAALGCGPRDSLMVALARRLPRVPIGLVRGTIEFTALAVGWLLGAKVGVGTVISVFGIGVILQITFRLFRFDARAVRHESLLESARRACGRKAA